MEPTRHEQYYMKDGINFQVENTLFKIPRYMLVISSPVLSPLLSSAHADDPPIRLANLKCTDFERLLALLYPLTPFTTVSDFWDEQDWISILRIATMWGMAEVRGRAIESLSKMSIRSPFTKITLGREYGHPKWVEEGFKMLSLRPEPLTPEECVHLTKEDVIKCAAAREGKIIVIPKATNKPAWRTVVEPKIRTLKAMYLSGRGN
ncbi:hypothetical protein K439DRAFT_107581 [Ramaria rubella]|nr:hypothetical protein K439DRAFT_107581 [Ramaria rubella]